MQISTKLPVSFVYFFNLFTEGRGKEEIGDVEDMDIGFYFASINVEEKYGHYAEDVFPPASLSEMFKVIYMYV